MQAAAAITSITDGRAAGAETGQVTVRVGHIRKDSTEPPGPDWRSCDGQSACGLKGPRLIPGQGHVPRLQVGSLAPSGCLQEATH